MNWLAVVSVSVPRLNCHRDLATRFMIGNYTDTYQCYLIAILPRRGSANEAVW
jgi:hypothetical protein